MKNSIFIGIFCIVWFGCNHNSVTQPPAGERITAARRFSDVTSLATTYQRGLAFMTINAVDVDTQGAAMKWSFEFVDTLENVGSTYCFHAASNEVMFDSTTGLLVGVGRITHRWIDSDSALAIADRNGGSQFRAQNPGYIIVASLGQPVVPNATTDWWITYRSAQNSGTVLLLTIDASADTVIGRNP